MELEATLGLITEGRHWFVRNVTGETRGHRYVIGGLSEEAVRHLYGLVRERQPEVLVETGVGNGVSTTALLAALDANESGRLYSIDWPEHVGSNGDFWPGKKGAVVPRGRESGWLVPPELRGRWELTTGRSQDALPPLLDRLGQIDFFLHDGEHSYECMTFEFELAWQHLRPTGILVVDDGDWNDSLEHFADKVRREIHHVGGLALLTR